MLVVIFLLSTLAAAEQSADPERFDGSYRLATGEIITGGYMVEGGKGRYVFMDTRGLEKGGLFEPVSHTRLRSIGMLGADTVEIEFLQSQEGRFDQLIWHPATGDSVRGERIYPHHSQPVEFNSGDGTTLSGRLLTPACEGPHPVVVSVHGSGPVNRFGGTFHTYFMQHGVAVLAYDKRGYSPDPDAWREPDLAQMSADVAAAVEFAARQPGIDSDRIGLFASSQGGWVAPPATRLTAEVDFMMVRAGAALTSAQTVLHEIRQEARSEGFQGLELDFIIDLRRELYELAMSGAPISAADALVAPYLDKDWYQAAFGKGPISEVWSEWWWQWYHRNHAITPVPALEQFGGPVLWFLAEHDENVPLVSTRAALERAFAKSPGNDQSVVVIENAPHSFIRQTEDGAPRYADGFFTAMGNWMDERGLSNPSCW